MARSAKRTVEFEEAVQRTCFERDILVCALHDLINCKVQWERAGPYRVGLSRPTGGVGGIVMVIWSCKGQSKTVNCYTYADWSAVVQRMRFATDSAEVRALGEVYEKISELHRKAYCNAKK